MLAERKPAILDGALASRRDASANSAPAPVGMNEEGANAGGVAARVERAVIRGPAVVPAGRRAPTTPADATDNGSVLFDDKAGAVTNQLAVNTAVSLHNYAVWRGTLSHSNSRAYLGTATT
jgi:hypothetical protein